MGKAHKGDIAYTSHSTKEIAIMSFFNRSAPCAPIHLVLPLLGSAVAFLSLISVFGVVATATH
jgi:hypothetical protein